MAGTIVVDRLESDASYASSINVASPLVVSNTINMNGGSITGNVNIDNGTLYVSQNKNTVGVGLTDPNGNIHLYAAQGNEFGHLRVETASNASLVLVRSGVQAWTMYVDNSDSSQLKIGPSNSGVALATKYFGIDTSGRVTMPNQPYARGSAAGNSGASAVIPIDTYVSSRGGITTSSNRFTVPVAGAYVVGYHHLGNSGSGACQVGIRKNGSFIGGTRTQDVNSGNDSFGTQSIVELAANDYIDFYCIQGSTHGNADYNSMWIWLIG
jgi:hypothetical protein